jgi:hypothetical protein
MEPTRINTLSVLLEQNVQPDPEAGMESAADACLVQRQFDDALSGYYQLDVSTPRIATKVAYCEWMVGHYAEARNRLFAVEEELEADGIGLLCELIRRDSDFKRRAADMEAIWPLLQAVIASESVPLIAATARARTWWPPDNEDREQRHRDLERLLSLHPESQHLRLFFLPQRNMQARRPQSGTPCYMRGNIPRQCRDISGSPRSSQQKPMSLTKRSKTSTSWRSMNAVARVLLETCS